MFRGTQIGVKSSGQPEYPQVLLAGARPGSGGVAVRCGRGQGGRGGGGSKGAGGGCREPCAGGAWVAGGSDAQLLGSRAGRRRLRPRLSFRGSALHQVRLTERSPCPSRMFSPAERRPCVSVCVWREREQRESRSAARTGVGAIPVCPAPAPPVTLPRCGAPSAPVPPAAFPGLRPGTGALAKARQGAGPAFSSGRGGASHWPKDSGARGSSQWEPWPHLTHIRGGARGRGRARESAGD